MLPAVMPMNTTAMSVPSRALTRPSEPATAKPMMPPTTAMTAVSTAPQSGARRSTGFEVGVRSPGGRGGVVIGLLWGARPASPGGRVRQGRRRRSSSSPGAGSGRRLGLRRDGLALAASEGRERERGEDDEADAEDQERPARVDAEVHREDEREQAPERGDRGPAVEDEHRVQVRVAHVEQPVVQVLAIGGERRLARSQAPEDREAEVEQRDHEHRERDDDRDEGREQLVGAE